MDQEQSRVLADIVDAMQSTNLLRDVQMTAERPRTESTACDRWSPCTNCRRLDPISRSLCSKKKVDSAFPVFSQIRKADVQTSLYPKKSFAYPASEKNMSVGTGAPRFLRLLDSTNVQEYRTYIYPEASDNSLACSLYDSVPNLPGLEFSRDFTDWILPTANGTSLIVKITGDVHRMEIRDLQVWQQLRDRPCSGESLEGSGDELDFKEKQRQRGKKYHGMLKFLDQFSETQTRWSHQFDQESTHRLIKYCAEFQERLVLKAMEEDRDLSDIDLLILDALQALGLSHQIAEVTRLLDDDDFEDHGYTEPTTLQAPSTGTEGKTIQVTKYNPGIHGPISLPYNPPEGTKLSSILKHVVLTCEMFITDIRQGHVIAAVMFLLTLVIADLATDVECVNTFDDDKLEEVLAEMCAYLESACQGHHPFQREHAGLMYPEQVDPAYEPHWCLFEQLKCIWNSNGLWQECEEETLLAKLRFIAFR
ncbi:hypothetical protein VTL71DRAFT_14098 [Oculimacula yallundae]|uniref:Uncharacterized protein n=1 Tax=Oculimacula yallundae TaxID=86028 RepID=A0ABR4CI38_9HELO